MNSKQIKEFVETLYPFFLEKMKNDGYFKNNVKMKNATVVSSLDDGKTNINQSVDVRLPYEKESFSIINKTGENLKYGDLVCLMYWIDLKNAVAIFKV